MAFCPHWGARLFITVWRNDDVLLFCETRFAETGRFAKQRTSEMTPFVSLNCEMCFAKRIRQNPSGTM
jgi:hypothetical protein